EKRRAWLLEVARTVDPDATRDRLRQPESWMDGAQVTRIANELKSPEISPQLACALGRVARDKGGDAVAILISAQQRAPQDFLLNWELGYALLATHRFEEALSYHRAALAVRPKSSAGHLGVASDLRALRRLDEAIDQYEQAVQVDSSSAVA